MESLSSRNAPRGLISDKTLPFFLKLLSLSSDHSLRGVGFYVEPSRKREKSPFACFCKSYSSGRRSIYISFSLLFSLWKSPLGRRIPELQVLFTAPFAKKGSPLLKGLSRTYLVCLPEFSWVSMYRNVLSLLICPRWCLHCDTFGLSRGKNYVVPTAICPLIGVSRRRLRPLRKMRLGIAFSVSSSRIDFFRRLTIQLSKKLGLIVLSTSVSELSTAVSSYSRVPKY